MIFPLPSFNAIVCPVNTAALIGNAEIVRVTGAAGDTFTIARTQEGSNARAIQAGDQFYAAITAKTIVDAEALTPIGSVQLFGGPAAPVNFLVCDGTAYPNATYPALAAVLGTTFGGDSTHFAVPDLQGRVPIGVGLGAGLTSRTLGQKLGEELHGLSTAELAAHAHGVNLYTNYVSLDHYHSVSANGSGATNGATADGSARHVPVGSSGGVQWSGYSPGGSSAGGNFPRAGSGVADSDLNHAHGFSVAVSGGSNWASNTHNAIDGSSADPNHRHATNGTSDSAGSGSGHNNMQPFVVLNYIIRAR